MSKPKKLVPPVTGVDTTALVSQLFGKDIPIFVGGEALMGCRIIEGPFLDNGRLQFLINSG